MGQIRLPSKAKLFCGLLSGSFDALTKTQGLVEKAFGPIDCKSQSWPFTHTTYYHDEMGPGLWRLFISFHELMAQDRLPEIKLLTNFLEAHIAEGEGKARPVNIDPGFLTLGKVILASTKNHSHRIYLREGIYAEVTLFYHKDSFQPWPWTYPDYRTDQALQFFNTLRGLYKEQLRYDGSKKSYSHNPSGLLYCNLEPVGQPLASRGEKRGS